MRTRSILVLFGLTLVSAAAASMEAAEIPVAEFDEEALAFYEAKVRPLLESRCFECHGPQAADPKGGLRLDSRAAALQGGDSGPVLVPGEPDESLLIQAVRYESFEMPPRSRLPEGEVAILVEWIRRGAPWPKGDAPLPSVESRDAFPLDERRQSHWAWQPIVPHAPPDVSDKSWPLSPIDRFILARLESEGLSPASPADRRTLIRRVTFDLIGLPPAPEDVHAFVADPAPTAVAFEKVVDRLLASPQFGERWGRHWLDLMRYAETLGHEFDYPIHHAWQYRDYVVRSLNADLPYDDFVREHIAGDLLPEPRKNASGGFNESIIGTGFWYLAEAKHAPVDVRGDEAVMIDNQIDVFSKAFLGMTVSCARCHDHKFDAISTRDFYALAGFLKSSRRQEAMLDPHGRIADAAGRIRALREAADEQLAASLPRGQAEVGGRFARLLLAARAAQAEGGDVAEVAARFSLDPGSVERAVAALGDDAVRSASHPLHVWSQLAPAGTGGGDFAGRREALAARLSSVGGVAPSAPPTTELFEDFDGEGFGDWFVTGEAFGDGPTTSRQWAVTPEEAELFAPGTAHSGRLAKPLRGVLRSRTFTITHPQILYRLAGENAQVRLIIDGYFMDVFSPLLFSGCAFPVNTGGEFVWHRQSGDVGRYLGHRAHIELIDHGDGWVAVDEIRFADAGAEPPSEPNRLTNPLLAQATIDGPDALAKAYGAILNDALAAWHAGTISREQQELLCIAMDCGAITADEFSPELKELAAQIDAIASQIPDPMLVLALTDGTGEDERVHIRGSHRNLGDPVPRRMLEAIGGADQPAIESGSGRLELADRLLDPANPLPARVMVNRVWHHLFGRGIVASVDNFGVLGDEPTHPELLDHLAAGFIADDWSLKRLIRRIVLSRTYQMAITPDPRAAERDPRNRLLHSAPIRRLQGEAIRDSLLALSGRLDRKMSGPSVPVHLTPFMQGRGRPSQSGPLDGDGRRSLYIEVRRNFLPPMMLAFDTPIPFTCIGRRTVSNVPAQALILMNDPLVIEQARLWARRALARTNLTAEERIARLYEEAFGRAPSEDEVAQGLAFLQDQATAYSLPDGVWERDEKVWKDLCHVLVNVKEFLFVP